MVAETQTAQYNQARDKALEALYVQSGYKKDVDELNRELEVYAKSLDKKYIPEYLHTPGGVMVFILKAVHDHQLTCKWSF